MKIALIGATGSVGSRVLSEALSRGHEVTGLSRHPDKLEPRKGLQCKSADISQPLELGKSLQGHDVVVSSVRFRDFDVADLLAAVRASGVARLSAVADISKNSQKSMSCLTFLGRFGAQKLPSRSSVHAGRGGFAGTTM